MASQNSAAPSMDDLLKLDNQLCFRLYAASRMIIQAYRPILEQLGITYPQYLVLLAMWQWQDEGQLQGKTQKDLIERLRLDSGTMTPLYRRMEDAGLVTRQVNEKDKRASFITLTEQGTKLKNNAQQQLQHVLCQFSSADGDVDQFQDLRDQLDELLGLLGQFKG